MKTSLRPPGLSGYRRSSRSVIQDFARKCSERTGTVAVFVGSIFDWTMFLLRSMPLIFVGTKQKARASFPMVSPFALFITSFLTEVRFHFLRRSKLKFPLASMVLLV